MISYTDSNGLQYEELTYPTLTQTQKNALKTLMDNYFNENNKAYAEKGKYLFFYKGVTRREAYAKTGTVAEDNANAVNACLTTGGQYLLNCGLFAQMIWMGRKIEDFTGHLTKPITTINSQFTDPSVKGYYFDFLCARTAQGVIKDDKTKYSDNTYINSAGTQVFLGFDGAAAMADELYRKGYDIPYSAADVGDILFTRFQYPTDGDTDEFESTSFRNISHAAMVYDKKPDGTLVILECTNAYNSALGKAYMTLPDPEPSTFPRNSITRGHGLDYKVVMCARHPMAYEGFNANVKAKFEVYRGVDKA